MTNSEVKLIIALNDPELEAEELDEQVQHLIAELKHMDEVEVVNRVIDPSPPEGNKALGGFLVGSLTAKMSAANAKKILLFLGDRLGNKPIELSVEANGKKLSVKANSREELKMAIQAAQEFIEN